MATQRAICACTRGSRPRVAPKKMNAPDSGLTIENSVPNASRKVFKADRYSSLWIPDADGLYQSYQSDQLGARGIRNGTILQISLLPEHEVIAVAGRRIAQLARAGSPAEHVDDVCTMLVDDHRRTLMSHIVRASAHELIAF